jgi:AcrR family transcriptional regulator
VGNVLEEAPTGLRERKKQRTRAMLIDAAIDLCLRNGYEQTTVEQIAAAADVSPRTFSRYFATKDAVFLTLIEDYVEQVTLELASIPPEVGPLEALRVAHVATLSRVAKRPTSRLSEDRIVLMLRVINASDALRQAAFDYKHEPSHVFVAQRLGVPVDDRRVQLVGTIFSSVIVTACGDLIEHTDGVRLGAEVMIDRLNQTFAQLALFAADLQPPVAEPSYEAVNG